jgi:hypothetical protein
MKRYLGARASSADSCRGPAAVDFHSRGSCTPPRHPGRDGAAQGERGSVSRSQWSSHTWCNRTSGIRKGQEGPMPHLRQQLARRPSLRSVHPQRRRHQHAGVPLGAQLLKAHTTVHAHANAFYQYETSNEDGDTPNARGIDRNARHPPLSPDRKRRRSTCNTAYGRTAGGTGGAGQEALPGCSCLQCRPMSRPRNCRLPQPGKPHASTPSGAR